MPSLIARIIHGGFVLALLGATPALAVDLPDAVSAKAKKATVFIVARKGSSGATGSGFLIRSDSGTGYIVTNHHVVDVREDPPSSTTSTRPGPPRGGPPGFRPPTFGPRGPGGFAPPVPPPPPPPPVPRGPGFPFAGGQKKKSETRTKVTVVLNSGQSDEITSPAEIVAFDPEADLAVLRITGVRNLPAPLDITQDPPVAETQPVFILGFPGGRKGKAENPTVNLARGSISGLRYDSSKRLTDVHMNGEVNPGNSGGPVIDVQGRLIGVAVASVRDKQIGFAVPTAQLNEMFKGSVLLSGVVSARKVANKAQLRGELWLLGRGGAVRDHKAITILVDAGEPFDLASGEFLAVARLTDPMLKLGTVTLHYAPVAAGAAKTFETKPLPNAQTVPFELDEQFGIAKFKLPPGTTAEQAFAYQVSYTNADGQTQYTQPHVVEVKTIEPQAANTAPISRPGTGSRPIGPGRSGLANAKVGEETEIVAAKGKKVPPNYRRAEAGKPMLGISWTPGFWAGEKCLRSLAPIYDRPENQSASQVVAKPGYAVGAITVKTKNFINGIQITFMKLAADGKSLDPKDSYTGPWMGPHEVGVDETVVGGNGRLVIGLACFQAGALDSVGLVLEAK